MFTIVSKLITRLPELDDGHAWSQFDELYSPILKQYFRKYAPEHVAGDLAQETMQRIADGLRRGKFQRDRGRLRDWIGGIARNVLRNYLRKVRSRTDAEQLNTQFWHTQADPVADAAQQEADDRFDAIWVRARLSQLLRLAAQTFEHRDLKCYFLVEVRRLRIKEVAARTKLSETAVYQKRRKVANWFSAVAPRFISRWEA